MWGIFYFNSVERKLDLSTYLRIHKIKNKQPNLFIYTKTPSVKIISYCIMPDHYHLLIKILLNNYLSKYINDLQNSFSRYFNIRFKRKGPLWQSRFRSIKVKTNEQLLHVSRYIHLNPTTSKLVNKPEDWEFSSYKRFIKDENLLKNSITEISIKNRFIYKKFCENQINYQQKLKVIKKILLE
ncbi:MAG: transposase [Nanoarchaeota archaeon]